MDPKPAGDYFNWSMIWALVVFIGGIVLAIWSKISFAKKSDVYKQNGQTKFTPTDFCTQKHMEHGQILLEIKGQIKEMDEKREASKGELTQSINNLNLKIGQIQGRLSILSEIKGILQNNNHKK